MKQREIKFRAWDKEKKVMSAVRSWDFAHGDVELGKELQPEADKFTEEVELMQYTGLTDRNGVEIYEGDIVKWGHHCERCRENPVRIAKVEINPDIQFNTKNVDCIFHYGNFAYQDTENHLEVIGNIYENKELLT